LISFLEGTIEHLDDKYVILNVGGIGYKVIISPKLANILSKSTQAVNSTALLNKGTLLLNKVPLLRLFVHSQLNMREGTFDMYGFDKKEDLDLFHMIITVSGIGPKGAINILSVIEPKHLKAAIINEDLNYLRKVSGLGTKTAQRLVLELKSKVDYMDIGDVKDVNLSRDGQAIEALLTLGYSQYQAKEALKESKGKTLEERVREALRLLGKK